jgi:hypothetical protein
MAGLKLRKLKRKESAAKSDADTGVVGLEDLEGVGDGEAYAQADSPQPKKIKTS